MPKACTICGHVPSIARNLCRRCYGRERARRNFAGFPVETVNDLDRVMGYVAKHENGCWYWKGEIGPHGYGHAWLHGKRLRAHRVVYEVIKGSIPPPPLILCHTCDNRQCVNPDHLFIGTKGDNIRDAVRKGRYPVGERHWAAKLTDEQASAIKTSGERQHVLARRYGVSQALISRIKVGLRRAR